MSKKDYTVGYGKPPKAGQFKPGQSGNKKGRPKGSNNLSTDLAEELQEKIIVKEGGVSRKLSKQRAMIKAVIAKALQGDSRATTVFLNMFFKLIPPDDDQSLDADFSPTDLNIIKEFEAQILATAKKKK